jgi:hypothetical protein
MDRLLGDHHCQFGRAQWTDLVLYSPYVGLGPSRKLDHAYVAGMASGFGGWHHTYKKLHT